MGEGCRREGEGEGAGGEGERVRKEEEIAGNHILRLSAHFSAIMPINIYLAHSFHVPLYLVHSCLDYSSMLPFLPPPPLVCPRHKLLSVGKCIPQMPFKPPCTYRRYMPSSLRHPYHGKQSLTISPIHTPCGVISLQYGTSPPLLLQGMQPWSTQPLQLTQSLQSRHLVNLFCTLII